VCPGLDPVALVVADVHRLPEGGFLAVDAHVERGAVLVRLCPRVAGERVDGDGLTLVLANHFLIGHLVLEALIFAFHFTPLEGNLRHLWHHNLPALLFVFCYNVTPLNVLGWRLYRYSYLTGYLDRNLLTHALVFCPATLLGPGVTTAVVSAAAAAVAHRDPYLLARLVLALVTATLVADILRRGFGG